MVKAIFFDIDGTLVSFNTHRISEATYKALDKLREKGIKLFIASGRDYRAIDNLGDWQPDGYVTLNGGMCIVDEEIIHEHPIHADDVQNLIDHLKQEDQAFPCVFVQREDSPANFLNEDTTRVFDQLNYPAPDVRPLEEIEGKPAYQLIAFFKEDHETEMMKMLPNCETTRWNPLFTDVIPKGGSKWIGILKILERFGIDQADTMAFGDGGNDIEMLSHVGIGVAMGNAEDEVKAVADYVTGSVDEDGIAKALEHFGLI